MNLRGSSKRRSGAVEPDSKKAKTLSEEKSFCPVVVMGASAGGLEVFQQFFTGMPADSGMSFVLVQHLSPEHETLIPELLARHTTMPVIKIADGVELDPNHVYVAPPRVRVELEKCTFRLRPAVKGPRPPLPIDDFFRSAASDQGPSAIGIILSGTGPDGTLGLKAIKEGGGMTMAQSPETARYEAMPRNAITMGLVDFVLPVAEMPPRIIEYIDHLKRLMPQQTSRKFQAAGTAALSEICPLLLEKTGHDFSRYKPSTLLRRLHRRMQITGEETLPGYLKLLENGSAELDALFKDLLIGVTQFFRDPEAFAVVAQEAVAEIVRSHNQAQPLRIWVPGCATGEEAYSLAILIAEACAAHRLAPHVQIFGTDLDGDSLDAARKARYPEAISEQVTPERLKLYFVKKGASYEVVESIREMCIFSPHNLIKDPPFSRLDLISCRNLLIYFEVDLQRKLLPLFHYALKPSGFLFLGPAENLAARSELFRTVDKKARLFQRKPAMLHASVNMPLLDVRHGGGRLTSAVTQQAGGVGREQSVVRTIERVILDEFAPPGVIVDAAGEILYFSGRTGPFLEPQSGVPNNRIVSMVRKSLRPNLRTALHRSTTTRQEVVRPNLVLQAPESEPVLINLIVRPLAELGKESDLFVVLFQEVAPASAIHFTPVPNREEHSAVAHLENELQTTREDLQTTIEELETSNEELKSANEELLSMNEELQSTNEELQTSKEELQSLNDELQRKVEELDNTHSDLQNLVQASDVGTVFLNPELCVKRFTPATGRFFPIDEERMGRPIQSLLPTAWQASLLTGLREVAESAHPAERLLHETKEDRWIAARILPYRSLDQTTQGLVLTLTDITEVRRAEMNRMELAAIVESSQDAIIGLSLDGTIRSWNVGAERLYGYSVAEVRGQHLSLIAPTDRIHEVQSLVAEGQRNPAFEPIETVRRHKDGRLIDISLAISQILDPNGLVVGLSAVGRDITARKAIENQLRINERELQDFFENAVVGLTWLNPEGRIERANRTELLLLGYDEDEYVGRSFRDFHIDPAAAQEIAGLLERDGALHDFEAQLRGKDGRARHVLIDANVYFDQGRVSHTRCFTRDITARKEAEALLSETNTQMRRMMDRITDGFAAVDRSWRLTYLNKRIASDITRLGKEPAQVLGRELWAEFPDLIGTPARAAYLRAMEQQTAESVELYYPNLDSWFLLRVFPSSDGLTIYSQDITEQKKVQTALLESEARLEMAFDAAQMGAWEWNIRTERITWSPSLEKLHNFAPGSFPGTFEAFQRDILPEDQARVAGTISRCIEERTNYSSEYRFFRADGQLGWIEAKGRLLLDAEGNPERLIGVCLDITARKATEVALQESEARARRQHQELDAIYQSAPVGLYVIDRARRYLRINQTLAEINGRTIEETLGCTVDEVVPDVAPVVEPYYEQLFQTGEPLSNVEIQVPLSGPPGNVNHWLLNYYPLKAENGSVVALSASVQNITAWRRNEVELRTQKETLETLNTLGARFSAELDLSRLIQEITDVATRISGAAFGAFFYNVLKPEGGSYMLYTLSGVDREAFSKFPMPRATALFGPTFRGEGVIRSGDVQKDPRYGKAGPHHGLPAGHLPVRSYMAVPVSASSGEVIGGLFFGHPEPDRFTENHERLLAGLAGQAAVAIDNARLYEAAQTELAERKRAEEALRYQSELTKVIADNAASCLLMMDQRGHPTYVNPAFEEVTGYKLEEIRERPAHDSIHHHHPDGRPFPMAECPIDHSAESLQPIKGHEDIFVRKDGTFFPVRCFVAPLAHNGATVGAVVEFRDITAERQSQVALSLAQDKLSRYAGELEVLVAERTASLKATVQSLEGVCYTIAHDLRAPLRALQGFTRILQEDYAGALDEAGKTYAARIVNAATRMDQLIKDLLDYARLSHLDLPLQTLDLHAEVKRVLTDLSEEIDSRQARIEVGSLPAVRANETLLQQILLNLIMNALKFVAPGRSPEVHIWAEVEPAMVRLKIRDNGIGIDPDHHERVFGLFQRLHSSVTYPGTGIGLAIVQKAAERLGGTVGVDSVLGEGSCFFLELPLASPRP